MQQISRFVKEFKFRVFNRKGKLVVVRVFPWMRSHHCSTAVQPAYTLGAALRRHSVVFAVHSICGLALCVHEAVSCIVSFKVTSAMGASKVAKSVFRGITKGDTIEESDLKGYLDDADIDAVFSVLKEEINRSIHNRTFEVFVRTLYADYKSLTRSVTDFSSVNKALQYVYRLTKGNGCCRYNWVEVVVVVPVLMLVLGKKAECVLTTS